MNADTGIVLMNLYDQIVPCLILEKQHNLVSSRSYRNHRRCLAATDLCVIGLSGKHMARQPFHPA